jgi:hypothetical protein
MSTLCQDCGGAGEVPAGWTAATREEPSEPTRFITCDTCGGLGAVAEPEPEACACGLVAALCRGCDGEDSGRVSMRTRAAVSAQDGH